MTHTIWNEECFSSYGFFPHGQLPLRWRHNGRDSVSNHQPHVCLLNRLFRRRSKKTSKLRVTGLCVGNSPGTGEFPAQMASNAENVSIWWRHHVYHRRTHLEHYMSGMNTLLVFNWVIIGLGNGLWPVQCQSIAWTNLANLWIFHFQENVYKISSS